MSFVSSVREKTAVVHKKGWWALYVLPSTSMSPRRMHGQSKESCGIVYKWVHTQYFDFNIELNACKYYYFNNNCQYNNCQKECKWMNWFINGHYSYSCMFLCCLCVGDGCMMVVILLTPFRLKYSVVMVAEIKLLSILHLRYHCKSIIFCHFLKVWIPEVFLFTV